MNNNNKKSPVLNSKDTIESETRVFARLISRSETKKVSGAKETCTSSKPINGQPRIDCIITE